MTNSENTMRNERQTEERDQFLLQELESRILDTVGNYVRKVPRPYSAVVSGGFDSGLLAAIAKPNMAFRMKFPYGSQFDETVYADAISRHLDLQIIEIEVTPDNFRKNFEPAVKLMGEPTTHFSLVPLYIMMEKLSSWGEKNVLSGEGPDEYLGGYARQIIFDELNHLYEIPELRNYHPTIDRVLGIDRFLERKGTLIERYKRIMGYDGEFNLATKLPLQGAIGKMDMQFGTIEKMEQKLAGHFGINFHYPYINDEFAEYCYKLPDDLKIRDGVTKWGFKQIAMKYLPEILRDRPKMGGPVAPVNLLMGWDDLQPLDKSRYIEEQKKILGLK